MIKPVLIFGYGNVSRGDDALGPLALEFIRENCHLDNIELLTDYQLQIEHALDIENRKLVLFIDAAVNCENAFDFVEIRPVKDHSYSSHAMSPAALLTVYEDIKKQPPPTGFLLSVKGEHYGLGEDLSLIAKENLALAIKFATQLLKNPDVATWRSKVNSHSMQKRDALDIGTVYA